MSFSAGLLIGNLENMLDIFTPLNILRAAKLDIL